MKIFVSGLYGSGKTTFSKKFAERNSIEYISFDDNFNYTKNLTEQAKNIFNMLADRHYIMDAIPFNIGLNPYSEFDKYYDEHRDVFILFTFCSDFDAWIKRIKARENRSLNIEQQRKNYRENIQGVLNRLCDKILFFYDSHEDKFVDLFEFKKLMIDWIKND